MLCKRRLLLEDIEERIDDALLLVVHVECRLTTRRLVGDARLGSCNGSSCREEDAPVIPSRVSASALVHRYRASVLIEVSYLETYTECHNIPRVLETYTPSQY